MKYLIIGLLLIASASASHAADRDITVLGSVTTKVMNSVNGAPKNSVVEIKLFCIAGYKFVLVGDSLSLMQVFSADKQGVKCSE